MKHLSKKRILFFVCRCKTQKKQAKLGTKSRQTSFELISLLILRKQQLKGKWQQENKNQKAAWKAIWNRHL